MLESCSTPSDSPTQRERINRALSCSPVDLSALQALSREPGGFLSNTLRARVWPCLLDLNTRDLPDYKGYVKVHRDAAQLRCDIDRSFWSLDCARSWGRRKLARKRAVLSDLITALLVRRPALHYFQGLHDVASVLVLVLQDDVLALAVMESLAARGLGDFMRRDFTVLARVMRLILTLVQREHPALGRHLEAACTEPYFATSWLITWLSHDIRNVHDSARLFDVFLSSPPEYCLYFCASLVLLEAPALLLLEPDFTSVHAHLSRMLRPSPGGSGTHTQTHTGKKARAESGTETTTSSKHSGEGEQSQRQARSQGGGGRPTPGYPFDLEAALALTDRLIRECPPGELVQTDLELRNMIVECKMVMFNPATSPAASARSFSLPAMLRASSRLLPLPPHAGRSVAGWRAVLLTDQGWGKDRVGKERRRIMLLGLGGGLLSLGLWVAQSYMRTESS